MRLVTVSVSATGHPVVVLAQGEEPTATEGSATTEEQLDEGPSPIAPELKELAWGAGAFVVLAILVRVFLFPRLKRGMDARHDLIRDELETADATRAAAEGELAEYNTQLAAVRSEANARIDAARLTLESERQARLAEVNIAIAQQRSAAAAEAEAAKAAARDQVLAATAQVAAIAAERALGRPVDAGAARAAAEAAMSVGAR